MQFLNAVVLGTALLTAGIARADSSSPEERGVRRREGGSAGRTCTASKEVLQLPNGNITKQ